MLFHVFHDKTGIRIGVAVSAKMAAGVVGTDVRPQNAPAGSFPLGTGSTGNIQMGMQGRFKSCLSHAT